MELALLNFSPACHGQLMRMLITNEPHGTFVCYQIAYFLFKRGPATDIHVQSCDEDALRI